MDQLRKRRDFLAAAKAERAGVSAFLLQGRDRGDGGAVRIGFTVTKKTGNAVVRNRIRRRLREVARQVVPAAGRPGYDYVLVAREQALGAPFGSLLNDLGRALRKLHDPARAARPGGAKRSQRAPHDAPADAPSRGGGTARGTTGPAGASPQAVATGRGAAPHSDSTVSSDPQSFDPQARSADGGHPA
ncbi:ribonuclease P protein component [Xanthobacter sediminis]